MSAIRNIRLTIPIAGKQATDQPETNSPSAGECRINLRANEEWTVTGNYKNNLLWTIELQRKSTEPVRECHV